MHFNSLITTIDTHTMGEPTRVVTAGLGPIPGRDMAAKKTWFLENKDHLRRSLLWEPRGHQDMFGAIITEPAGPKADIGVLFMDSGGYLDMCGHGSIGAVTAVLETGMVALARPPDPSEKTICLDTPAGLIEARVHIREGRCQWVRIRNQPAFWHSQVCVPIQGQDVAVDVVYGGNYFGLVNAADLGLDLVPENLPALTRTALDLRTLLNSRLQLKQPGSQAASEVALIEFYAEHNPPKNVVIFGSGQIDRSPCGTGTCAKMALLHHHNKLLPNQCYTQQSILETEFYGTIVQTTQVDGRPAIVPEITGRAFITGFHHFVIDPEDPFRHGFQLYEKKP